MALIQRSHAGQCQRSLPLNVPFSNARFCIAGVMVTSEDRWKSRLSKEWIRRLRSASLGVDDIPLRVRAAEVLKTFQSRQRTDGRPVACTRSHA